MLQCVAVCCGVSVQRVVCELLVHCSVLQCVAMCLFSVFHVSFCCIVVCRSVLQCVAACCNMSASKCQISAPLQN